MTLIFSLKRASGSRLGPSSIAAPAPRAHQCGGEMPSPMNRQANRFGAWAAWAVDVGAATAIDSSQGSATETPMPLRSARREIFEAVMDYSLFF
jgi:hypothetical protein